MLRARRKLRVLRNGCQLREKTLFSRPPPPQSAPRDLESPPHIGLRGRAGPPEDSRPGRKPAPTWGDERPPTLGQAELRKTRNAAALEPLGRRAATLQLQIADLADQRVLLRLHPTP